MEQNSDDLNRVDPEELTDRDLLEAVFRGVVVLMERLDALEEKVQDLNLTGDGFQMGRYDQ